MRNALNAPLAAVLAIPLLAGCASNEEGGSSGGSAAAAATGAAANAASRVTVPSLVNVNLKDVLNDLAVKLNLDEANVPVTIQLPINLAVNVCGVSINVLAASTGGQAQCDAKSAPQELAQVVQQQMAAGGSVGGGAQGDSTSATGSTTPASPAPAPASGGTTNPVSPPGDPAKTQ